MGHQTRKWSYKHDKLTQFCRAFTLALLGFLVTPDRQTDASSLVTAATISHYDMTTLLIRNALFLFSITHVGIREIEMHFIVTLVIILSH